MLQISSISRPDRFLNEDMPFVNTAGTMNFNLTSPELLDLDSYQQTLRRLILVLAASSTSKSNTITTANDNTSSNTTEVILGSGGAFILDTSVAEPGFEAVAVGQEGSAQQLSSTQSYPLSFIATSQLPSLRSSNGKNGAPGAAASPVLYFIRLPLNPFTHGIQCQLSARRLCAKHVSLLDRILRRLCDASPGAFIVGYSDGLSGVDAGTEVVYSGENSSLQPQPSMTLHQHQQHEHQHHLNQAAAGVNLEQSVAAARDRGDMDIDHRVAGLVGHVEHPTATTGAEDQRSFPHSSTKSVKALRTNTTESSVVSGLGVRERNVEKSVLQDSLTGGDGAEGVLNYDFGLLDDMDQLIDVHAIVDIDELHDMLWVN